MAIPARGMKDIRTHLGGNPGQREAYQLFMEISGLEMERARRQKERVSALRQVEKIETRFSEIDARKAKLLLEADSSRSKGPAGPAERREAEKVRREAALSRTAPAAHGFRIKY